MYKYFIVIFFSVQFSLLSLSISENFKKGEKYFYQKKFAIAAKFLEKVLESQPDHAKSISLLGDIYLIQKKYGKAERYYRQAIEVSSNPAKDYFRLGQIYTKRFEADKAIAAYEKSYSLDQSLSQALFHLGYVGLTLQRDKEKTIQYWEKFLTQTPLDYQYEKIKKVLTLLKDANFKIPPLDSEVSLAEALALGKEMKADGIKTKDSTAGNEKEQSNNESKGLLEDPDL